MTVNRAADATLSALVVNDGSRDLTLSPGFTPGATSYTTSVANRIAEVTVTPTTTHAAATIEYFDGDDVTLTDAGAAAGHQVTLEEGDNVIKVKVTAEDGTTIETYTVTVTRRAVDAPGDEGDLRLTDEKPYTSRPDGTVVVGVEGRVEIFHAGRWGTVCDDGFSRETTSRFKVELDADGNATDNVTESEHDNDAPALVCQSMGYTTGEYASGFGRPGPSQPSALASYSPVGETYPANGPLPIWVDDMTCAAGDADLTVDALPAPLAHCGYAGWGLHNCTHNEDAGVRCWNVEDSAMAGARALKARFVSPPERHDGSGRVKVRVAFSEAIEESPENVGEHGVKVEGGRVTSVRRVDNRPAGGAGARSAGRSGGGQEDGQEDGESVWEFEIEPGSAEDLTMRIDAGRPCDEAGAICTADGRSLSEGIVTTLEGPDPVALTAEFQGVPEAHDGEDAFRFRVAFSEDIGIGFRTMRDDSFTVSGGEVTGARRVDGRNDLWEITVAPETDGAVTITLPGGRECAVSGAICTRGENRRLLTNTSAATVAGPVVEAAVAPLTASFVQAPAEHDGSSPFKLRIGFSEGISISFRTFRDASVSVAGGSMTGAKRVDGRKDLWEVTVRPGSISDVTVTLEGGRACGTPGAVCTGDGRVLSATISTRVPGPPGLSVADAEVEEEPDAALAFAVTLSRAPSGAVTVDYATADGTAKAGADYTAVSGTLTFAPGERTKTVSVAVLDDAHDEGRETLTLTLSNASGAYIEDGTATGTIKNTDHMPKAWLARFGRTVAEQVLEAVGARIEGNSNSPGPARLTLGGHQVVLGASWPGAEGTLLGAGVLGPDLRETKDLLRVEADDSPAQEISTAGLLMASSFHMASAGGEDESGRWSLWARGSRASFSGKEDALTLEGDVSTGVMGADYERGRVLAGVALAYSTGEGSYTEADARGEVESTLLSAYPYLRYTLSDRLSVWGVLGLGEGGLTLEVENTGGIVERMETDISMGMAAFGARGKLASVAGYDLAVKTDVLFVRTESEAVTGLAAADAQTRRLRLALEGSREVKFEGGSVLTPSLEIGLRHDGGDAETGSGVELGGGLRWTNSGGLTMEVRARGLIAHEERDYEEWGVSASLALSPGEEGRGVSVRVGSTWGASSSGVGRLWSQRAVAGGEFDPDAGLNAEVGYGLDAMRGLLTPYTGVALTGGGETWRAGARWKLGPAFALNLEATLAEPEGDGEHEAGLVLRGSKRW